MSGAKMDAERRVHRDWINALQPVGLVVSPPALTAAQAFPDKNVLKEQRALAALVTPKDEAPAPKASEPAKRARKGRRAKASAPRLLPLSFADLAIEVLGWKPSKLVSPPESLEVVRPQLGETLRATYAVPAVPGDEGEWMMLVHELPDGTELDEVEEDDGKRWRASPHARFELLLKETRVPIGVLTNGRAIRLVYAPRTETSGHMTWPVEKLLGAMDREPLFSPLVMLLGSARLFSLGRDQRLPHILRESRKYQSVVSTQLAGQVLEALNELLRGFQAANAKAKGALLDETVSNDPDHVYGGLLAALLRLVFVLYAEERGLLSSSAIYVRSYSLGGLFEKLRADAGRFPDTMDERYGAWSRLLVLFRMIHDGARRGDFVLPPRYGHLFDPDGWAFLEGRPYRALRVKGERADVPKVSDGVVLRVLEKLLLLDGDRLSYRALDVEQIGSVYENMMGFRLERASEVSIGLGKDHVVVGLETLLRKKGKEREQHLKEAAGVEVSGKAGKALKEASTLDELASALSRRTSALTPRPVPREGLYLQPTDERRRSGSHYTPRELTEPIVRTTLRPILEDLGPSPTPEQILALKVCDPAMGSGAFLVETCRQLGAALARAYDEHGRPSDVPPGEDIELYAQRMVAERSLYGVDKNPFAVDLGKLSLWLATLAKDHAFTFLDHSIRHGDSLLGLSLAQLTRFDWLESGPLRAPESYMRDALGRASEARRSLHALAGRDDDDGKRTLLREADEAIEDVRLIGDAVLAAFFESEKPKERRARLDILGAELMRWLGGEASLRERLAGAVIEQRLSADFRPFHWPVEFPEVLDRPGAGFDAIVGNPPYLGGTIIGGRLGLAYHDYLVETNEPATGLADLIAFFVRRAFALLRDGGALGFVATNTAAQGDTRSTGLEAVVRRGGAIYEATKRYRWPGKAAVVASVFHVAKKRASRAVLDGREVERISSFLLAGNAEGAPAQLSENRGLCYRGAKVWGAGFVFEPEPDKGSSSLADMERLIAADSRNREVIFPYMGGEEFNDSPTQSSIRFVIDFGDRPEDKARTWPGLFAIVEERVRPIRLRNEQRSRREGWWLHANRVQEAEAYFKEHDRLLALSAVSKHLSLAFVQKGTVVADRMMLLFIDRYADFAIVQSRVHEVWARFLGTSMKDDLSYTTACFDTFPRPPSTPALEAIGAEYYAMRAAIMKARGEGLTKTYNRFHDPDETDPDIADLRALHDAMDRAVLDAYGWTEIVLTNDFALEFDDGGDDEPTGRRAKKKPWRYRWPDETRDEVLAHLLELNAQRAKGEATAAAEAKAQKPRGRGKKKSKTPESSQGTLFGGQSDE